MAVIYVMDEIEARPDCLEALRDAYFERYVPGAKLRSMTLEHCWRTPAADIPSRPATLYVVWSVVDAEAWWWSMRIPDYEEKAEFWSSVGAMIVRRDRRFLTDFATGDAG